MPLNNKNNKKEHRWEKSFVPDSRAWFKSYPKNISRHLSYPDIPIFGYLDQSAVDYPDRTALMFYGAKISYRKLKELSDRFAYALQKLGINKGDRVVLLLPNCPQFVIAFYAVIKIGAIACPLNPLYTQKELTLLLNDSGAQTIISLKRFFLKIVGMKNQVSLEKIIVSDITDYFPLYLKILAKIKELPDNIRNLKNRPKRQNAYNFKDLTKGPCLTQFSKIDVQEDPAILMYTSGTTGKPKGVVLTHFNIVSNLVQIFSYVKQSIRIGQEIQLGVLPFFHIYGLTFVLNFAVKGAFTLILFPKFQIKSIMKAIKQYKITIVPGVPAIFSAICNAYKKNPEKYDLSSVRFCGSGADPCPVSLIKEIKKLVKRPVIEAYGLTESSPVTHMNPLVGEQRAGSIGLPLPDTDAKILDSNTREEMPIGEPGELVIKGPQVFEGYWKNIETTRDTLSKEGWLHTKDIAFMDEQGYFYILGRLDDMINVKGEKVWPREIEEILKKHPGIEDAAVIGVKDNYSGQVPRAFIILRNEKDVEKKELIEFCKRSLAGYKVPRQIEFVSELPKSHLGKTLRRVLRRKKAYEDS